MTDERHDRGSEANAGPDPASAGGAEAASLDESIDGPERVEPMTPEEVEPSARPLRCTADGWEYFRIWIVNVALTFLTLGVYSAWAKVRTRRYLYGNVWLGDATFEYTANPAAILRGRLLLLLVLIPLGVAQALFILYYFAALLALMPLVPWVVVRARSFQLRNSRHRGIAFDFQGKYWDAAVWYPLSWVASIVTLGLARPFTVFGRDRFLVTKSRFGNRTFRFIGESGPYYAMYIATVFVVVMLYVVGSVFVFAASAAAVANAEDGDVESIMSDFLFVFARLVGAAAFAGAGLFVLAYLRSRLLSYRWSNTRLGDSAFHLHLPFPRMLWLYASNTAAIVATAGLFIPFARIRVLRYVTSRFAVTQASGEDIVEAGERQSVAATGAEAAGEFGLEIGI